MRSKAKYLYQSAGSYYFLMRVPGDLQHHFGTKWLKRSLRTTDRKNAQVVAEGVRCKAVTAYALLRSGMLTDDQTVSVVHSLFPPTKAPQVSCHLSLLRSLI